MKISIIIPTLNEAENIKELIQHVFVNSNAKNIQEIIVIDGGSRDSTIRICKELEVSLYESDRGRAKQMNLGAKKSTGQVLYFLHSDSWPPKNFDAHILNCVAQKTEAGCFCLKFNTQSTFLKINAWFSRLPFLICRGGDQSLFITKELFARINGFNSTYPLLEDLEIIKRIKLQSYFAILKQPIYTSDRRYQENGFVRLQTLFAAIHFLYWIGLPIDSINSYYNKHIS